MRLFGKKFYPSVAIAAIGIVGAILFTFTKGNPPPPPPNNLVSPPEKPFERAVSGTGLVEASSRNIDVGVFVSGIVATLNVNEGDKVKAGDILLTIDKRAAESDLAMKKQELASAIANQTAAKAQVDSESDLYKRYYELKGGVGISVNEQERQKFTTRRARAQWQQAVENVKTAEAAINSAKVFLEKHTVRAPIDGEVLKVRTTAGEFVNAGASAAPIVVGKTDPLHLRVQIDENDLWRFNGKAEATAFLRSNKERKYQLKFVRVEPLVLPKSQLSGDAAEKVDTRIMEVVYEIIPIEDAPLYVGQQLDVFVAENGNRL